MTQNAAFINGVLLLLEAHRQVFSQERVYPRAIALVIAEVFAFRQHRVTDLLRALGGVVSAVSAARAIHGRADWGGDAASDAGAGRVR